MNLIDYIVQSCKWARGLPVFVLFMCLSLYMLNAKDKEKQTVVDFVFSSILYLPQSVVSYSVHLRSISAENAVLRKENAKFKLEIDLAKEYAIENERLKKLLNFENNWNYPLILTQIVGYNPGAYTTTVIINNGSADSISYGMPVFTTNGLVGKVSKVFPTHSMVQLLSDLNSRVSVMSQRSRVLGTMFPRDKGDMQIQVSSYSDLAPGDTLVTSGFGGIYPKGIPVGVITKLDKNDSEILSNGNIELLQQIESLEEVFVIRKNMDWVVWDGN